MDVLLKLFILCLFSAATLTPNEDTPPTDTCPYEVSASHLGFRDADGKCRTFSTMDNANVSTLDSADRYCAEKYKHGKLAAILSLDTLNQRFNNVAQTRNFTILNGISLQLIKYNDVSAQGPVEFHFRILDYRWSKAFALYYGYLYDKGTGRVNYDRMVKVYDKNNTVDPVSSGDFVAFNSSVLEMLRNSWPQSSKIIFCSVLKEESGKFKPVNPFPCNEWNLDTSWLGFFCSHDPYNDCSANVKDCEWNPEKQGCFIVYKSREAELPFGKECDKKSTEHLLHAVDKTCVCPFDIPCKHGIVKATSDGRYKCHCFHGYGGSACEKVQQKIHASVALYWNSCRINSQSKSTWWLQPIF
ncbi:hypothetical protein TTRE_0000842401 [Trichuris trichiura]|uniref:EGF-like domain-containing protein n=1 Tax=Trichuris trichiura TaxID=36087 RepID=A0A077ZK47_TRITR|nr:hypothetical protein TTRE_0000842401 [Trichuris trichiura]